ncbi:ABC transporter substrate-binding protein [Georgenia deserti]|uniref:ABC transporter substrate-binding protein n=1 Tax=Georgenia deserti TaxID=2093781 RepID=A0ABW4L4R8_9MICO
MRVLSRRHLLAAAGAAMGAGVLSSCSGVAGSAGGGGGGNAGRSVRYAFWGNNVRQENYQAAFDEMADELPDINLELEFAEYNAYRERMTTQMAAQNVADVFWVPSPDVLTYHANGLFRRVDDLETLDLSDFSEDDIRDFELQGELNTVPFGIHVPVVRYNRTFADEDGVELPDEWDWNDLAEIARDYTNNNSHGRKALSYRVDHDHSVQNWLRQHGEQLWSEDGGLGFTAETLAEWIAYWENLRQAGATTTVSEQDGVEPSWTDIGDSILLHLGNANHAIDEADMFPDFDFGLKHPPIAPDAPEGFRFLYMPRMAVYANAADEVLEPAGEVLSYCINNTTMLRHVGLTMGTPINPRVAEEYREFASDIELEMLEVGEADRAATRDPVYESPPGASEWRVTLRRVVEGIINGETGISDGAQQIVDEVQRNIDRAS